MSCSQHLICCWKRSPAWLFEAPKSLCLRIPTCKGRNPSALGRKRSRGNRCFFVMLGVSRISEVLHATYSCRLAAERLRELHCLSTRLKHLSSWGRPESEAD